MAKKKTTSTAGAAKKSAGSKSKKAAASANVLGDVPMIDTNLAAQAAAKMLVNRATMQSGAAASDSSQPKPESDAFKQLKENLKNPRMSSSLLDTGPAASQKKSNVHTAFNKQTGHNQTYGHFNRAGVPRRTPG